MGIALRRATGGGWKGEGGKHCVPGVRWDSLRSHWVLVGTMGPEASKPGKREVVPSCPKKRELQLPTFHTWGFGWRKAWVAAWWGLRYHPHHTSHSISSVLSAKCAVCCNKAAGNTDFSIPLRWFNSFPLPGKTFHYLGSLPTAKAGSLFLRTQRFSAYVALHISKCNKHFGKEKVKNTFSFHHRMNPPVTDFL